MNTILRWIKRLFSANFIIIVLTAITAWLAYKQFSGNLGGKVVPVICSSEKKSEDYCMLICKTNDSVVLTHPQLFPQYKNISKRAISNFRLEYILEIPFQDKYFNRIKIEPSKAFTLTTDGFDASNHHLIKKYVYKTDKLYVQDETPYLIKRMEFLPVHDIDSLYHFFCVKCRISWDGKKDAAEYVSYINIRDIADSIPYNKKIHLDSLSSRFFDWSYSAFKAINGTVGYKTDLLLAYHHQQDSLHLYGFSSFFKDIDLADMDSLCKENFLQTHPQFVVEHLYGVYNDSKEEKIDWIEALLGASMLIFSIVFFGLFCETIRSKEKPLIKISVGLVSGFFFFNSIWNFDTVFLFFKFSLGCVLSRISGMALSIICLFFVIELICILIKAILNHSKINAYAIIAFILVETILIWYGYDTIRYVL